MVCLLWAPWCCSSLPLLLCVSPVHSWVCDSGLGAVWGFRQAAKMCFLEKGHKAEGFFLEKEKKSKLALPTYGSNAMRAPWWNAAGTEGSLGMSIRVGCEPSALPLTGKHFPLASPHGCLRVWLSPSLTALLKGLNPRLAGRGQELAAAGGLQMCVGAAPLGSTAGSSLHRLLEGTAQVWLPAGTGMAGMSFGTVFKAWAFWMQNLSPRASVLLQFFFNSVHLLLMAFSGCCRLPKRTKREKVVFCTCPGWLVTSHLAVLIQSKISAKFPSEKCFRESALWLGNTSLLPLLVCWVVRNMVEKPQGKDELNLRCCFFLNYKHCKIKMNTKSVTDFQNCAAKILISFLKRLKAFRVQNIFF